MAIANNNNGKTNQVSTVQPRNVNAEIMALLSNEKQTNLPDLKAGKSKNGEGTKYVLIAKNATKTSNAFIAMNALKQAMAKTRLASIFASLFNTVNGENFQTLLKTESKATLNEKELARIDSAGRSFRNTARDIMASINNNINVLTDSEKLLLCIYVYTQYTSTFQFTESEINDRNVKIQRIENNVMKELKKFMDTSNITNDFLHNATQVILDNYTKVTETTKVAK